MISSDRPARRRRLRITPVGRWALGRLGKVGVRRSLPVFALATALCTGACGAIPQTGAVSADRDRSAALARPTPSGAPAGREPVSSTAHGAPDLGAFDPLPGLGLRTSNRIPADSEQVVVVTGEGRNSPLSHVVLYRRTASGWQGGATWSAHNALKGWTRDHRLDDLRSPVGVFTLSDAGGLRADPGSKLPYSHSGGFVVHGAGFAGEPLAGSFDYVIAIDYNHVKGTSPLDWGRPLGADKGGGIWLHVDHGGPTHACVSLAEEHMKELLRTLDPARHPVIVMGDSASLAE
ncbi:L,D-transpeptidase family protein [Streptomyces sp. NPDC002690]